MATAVSSGVSSASPLSIDRPLERRSSILEKLEHLLSIGKDELPEDMIVREEDRSSVRHDDWKHSSEIPLIDLSLLQTDRAAVLKQIRQAVTEWGFFYILNHGIPLELMKDVRAQGMKFFALPPEIKEKATSQPGHLVGYTGDNTKLTGTTLHWAENLFFNASFVEKIASQVWPDGKEEFRDTMTKYASGAEKIGKQLHELIAESLGLSADIFAQHYGTGLNTFRLNFYPVCPNPTESMGAVSHTDPSCLTLLLQDDVGGLQIEKDGRWLAVRPMDGSLVVNIGDTLHAWTNGICRSVLHRGVVNKQAHRLSLAAFLNVGTDTVISAPEELIDVNHPRRYRAYTIREYISQYPKRVREKRSNGVSVLGEDFKFEN